MRASTQLRALALAGAVFSAGCGDDGGPTGSIDAAGSADAPSAAGEPCDYLAPAVAELGVTISAALPTASCASGLHFYRFTPATTGVYSIEKSGEGSLGFCETSEGGCICAGNINCCSACTLTFDLPDGSPLPAGSNNEIYIDPGGSSGTYTFTIRGPQ